MNTFFFYTSKALWTIFSPDSFVSVLGVLFLFFLLAKAHKKATATASLLCAWILAFTILPVGDWLLYPLEKRFPTVKELKGPVDGIIMLGGAENITESFAWDQAELNQFSERYFAFLRLARQFPEAKKVYSGGNGDPFRQELKGSEVAKKVFEEQGLYPSTVLFESESRNTYENALFTQMQVKPDLNQRWVLITSASHMPRAIGIFNQIGWPLIPYPVDHTVTPERLLRITWDFNGNFRKFDFAMKEWAGLAAYFLARKTSHFFPGPGEGASFLIPVES